MAKLEVVYNKKRKCITFFYDNYHQWNIFDVEEGSGTLEIFGRISYALEKNFEIKMEEVEE